MIFLLISFFQFSLCEVFTPLGNPLYPKQFYIRNTGSVFNGLPNEDLNVESAWKNGAYGENTHIVIISDGCQANHSEIVNRFDLNHSYNYETKSQDPSYETRAFIFNTGTTLATIAAGEDNEYCGIGIAPKATISCINIIPDKLEQGIKKDKDLNRSIRVFQSSSQLNIKTKYFYISDYDKNAEMYFSQPTGAVYVTSVAGGQVQLNDDMSYNLYTSNPYFLTFGELSQRGGRTLYSVRGNTVLASVVTGGGDYDSLVAAFSAYLSTGDGFDQTCSQTVLPRGTGCAMAAGVISQIISAAYQEDPTNELKRNDISVIIALTSVKNDPESSTWHTNAKGIRYSSVYGFGRLDAGKAVELAKKYKHRELANDASNTAYGLKKVGSSFRKSSLPMNLPSYLSGFSDVVIELPNSSIEYIEFVEVILSFSKNISEYSLLRIFLRSPSGTERMIKDIAPIVEQNSQHQYRIAARDFFGERAGGNWTLRILHENIGRNDYQLTAASLFVAGYTTDDFPQQVDSQGANPFSDYSKVDAELQLPNLEPKDGKYYIRCNQPYHFVVNTSSSTKKYQDVPFDLVLVPEKGPYERFGVSNADQDSLFVAYCHYKSGHYSLRAIHPVFRVQTQNIPVEFINDIADDYSETGFGQTDQYRVIHYSQAKYTAIPINVLYNNRETFSNFKVGYLVIANLWNLDTNELYGNQTTQLLGGYYIYPKNESCHHCLLIVTPLETDDLITKKQRECNTFVNALSIVEEGFNGTITPFEIPWNDVCPVPMGLIVPTPKPSFMPTETFSSTNSFIPTSTLQPLPPDHHVLSTTAIILISVSTCLGLVLITFIICCVVRRRILKPQKQDSGINSLLLLDEKVVN